jgi:copper chaperone
MTCGHCVHALEQAIMAAAPGAKVEIDLVSGKVTVEGADDQTVANAVDEAGFAFQGAI